MSKENEWEDDPDMQEFLEWADQPGPWDEEDDKIHTVGGLTNDKENGFMSFINKTKMSKEQLEKLKREWLDSGDWKTTSLDLEFKVWLEMKGYKLSQEEFNELKTKER